VYATNRKYDFNRSVMSPFDLTYWESRATSFASVSADVGCRTTLTGAGDPERVRCASVTPEFFEVMGDQPALGRAFTTDEAMDEEHVVVMSSRLWRSRFGGQPDILNGIITLDGESWRVVGIMPDHFAFPQDVVLWRPLHLTEAQRANMGTYYLGVLARLRPEVSIDDAQAELNQFGLALETAYPERRTDRGFFVSGLQDELGFRSADGLKLLQGVVVFVLLIASANVANLLLAQTTARRQEFAVRTAVGGSRGRLIRQALTESIVLALAGAAAGTMLAVGGVEVLVSLAPSYLLAARETIGVSWPVLAVTGLVATGTGILFGLAPALLSSSVAPGGGLGQGTRTASGGLRMSRRSWLRPSLVAAEVALALILLTGAGLLVRSFAHLMNQPPGFSADHVLSAQMTLPATRYPGVDERGAFWTDLVQRLQRLPGVTDAAGSSALPFSFWEWQTAFTVVGREDVPNDGSGIRTVTEGLFDTLQIPVLAGRGFTAADRLGAPSVAVVSDAFARQFLTDLDPVGQRLRFPQADEDTTIVGVVGATRHLGLDEEPRAEIYLPFAQDADRATLLLAIRTSGDPALLAEALRRTVADLDRGLPVEEVKTMGALIAGRVAERRFYMTLLALFAGLAAVLAATGIYGVMSCLVGQSRREIGIRLALGARPIQVRAGVVRQGLTVVAVGAALGLVGARWLSDLLATQLFEVPTTDWATYALATAGLAILATLACWMPTRMASIISPVEALRD
jgi:putative ABC transport system permease protein